MPPCNTADQLSVHRVCNIWKNGISWISLDGVNVLVEFSNSNELTVLLRTKRNYELHLVKLRSEIISTVLKAKKEYCPKIDVEEFFARNDSLSYPLRNDIELVNILEIAKSIVSCHELCYCNSNPNNVIEIDALLHFEPFSNLGHDLLYKIFSKRECEVTDEFLTGISDHLHSKTDALIKILKVSLSSLETKLTSAPRGVTHKLLCALKLWRNEEHSYSSLCTRLSQYSVFAGRNPLEVAGVPFENTCLSAEPTTNSCSATIPKGGAMRPFLTLEDLMRETRVDNSQLALQPNEHDFHKLANCFDNVEMYLDGLGLTAGQQSDIEALACRCGTKTAMVKALKLWHQPNPFAATFKALLKILLDLQRGDIAVKICRCITDKIQNDFDHTHP